MKRNKHASRCVRQSQLRVGLMMETTWQEIRNQLESERLRIQAEITSYPPPIPACDAYFNYLLERRALLSEELTRLDQAAATSAASAAPDVLEAFVRSSSLLGAGAAGRQTPDSV